MTLETANYINDLNVNYPEGSALKQKGDNHIRLIKEVLKNSLDGFTALILGVASEAQGASVNDYVLTLPSAPTDYATNGFYIFKATHTNSGTVTIALSGLGTKTCFNVLGDAVEPGEIQNGAICILFYDGTNFYNVTPLDRISRTGDTYSGAHNFTSATLTMPQKVDSSNGSAENLNMTGVPLCPTAVGGSTGNQVASLDFVVNAILAGTLPGQAGNKGADMYTDGTNATWRKFSSTKFFLSNN